MTYTVSSGTLNLTLLLLQAQIYVHVLSRQIAIVLRFIVEYKSHTTDTIAKYDSAIQLTNDSVLSR